jgi:hypothetical protein
MFVADLTSKWHKTMEFHCKGVLSGDGISFPNRELGPKKKKKKKELCQLLCVITLFLLHGQELG